MRFGSFAFGNERNIEPIVAMKQCERIAHANATI